MNFMKIIFLFSSLLLTLCIHAQPEAVKKSAAAVFTLTTFSNQGTIIASTKGVFIGSNGEAIAAWEPFIGAQQAVVVDANGQKMEVESVMGANELYDVCKFKVNGTTPAAPVAMNPSAPAEKVWLADYSMKKPKVKAVAITATEKFMQKYTYYIFNTKQPENMAGCPFFNNKGEVIGFLKHSKKENEVTATDAAFANDFELNGLSMNNPILRETAIRIALPQQLSDARLALMVAEQKNDSLKYAQYVDEFIEKFANEPDGYMAKARQEVAARRFDNAVNIIETALKTVTKKDEVHSGYATLIFNKMVFQPDTLYAPWTLEKAYSEATQAYALNPLPVYQHQQAQILFSMNKYQEAYNIFINLTHTNIRNGELFYEAAQCKQRLNAGREEILSLLDSAVQAQPLSNISAPYVLARGRFLEEGGAHRKALMDYNQYDTLMFGRASAEFYYTRYKCEMKLRSYQLALNDIAHAILINRQEPLYYAEMASLQLKVNQLDDAIKTSDMCIALAPDYADPYIIKGVALGESNRKAEACEVLTKAKELGDERAGSLLEKYKP